MYINVASVLLLRSESPYERLPPPRPISLAAERTHEAVLARNSVKVLTAEPEPPHLAERPLVDYLRLGVLPLVAEFPREVVLAPEHVDIAIDNKAHRYLYAERLPVNSLGLGVLPLTAERTGEAIPTLDCSGPNRPYNPGLGVRPGFSAFLIR